MQLQVVRGHTQVLELEVPQLKGFGLALNIPIINIPTMDALAYNLFSSSFVICPIMDARREQVYTGIYKFNGTTMEVIKPQCIMMIRDLVKELNNMSQAVMFNGDGVDAYKDIIEEEMTTEHYYAPAICKQSKGFIFGIFGRNLLQRR